MPITFNIIPSEEILVILPHLYTLNEGAISEAVLKERILEMAQQAEKIETEILYRKRERNCKTGMKQHLFKVLYCKPVSAYKKVTEQLRKLDELHVF